MQCVVDSTWIFSHTNLHVDLTSDAKYTIMTYHITNWLDMLASWPINLTCLTCSHLTAWHAWHIPTWLLDMFPPDCLTLLTWLTCSHLTAWHVPTWLLDMFPPDCLQFSSTAALLSHTIPAGIIVHNNTSVGFFWCFVVEVCLFFTWVGLPLSLDKGAPFSRISSPKVLHKEVYNEKNPLK